jgi:hypothetical protein
MNINDHTSPGKLEHYSFWWSEVRLVLAAIALFLGGYPLIYKIMPSGLTSSLLTISWLISGVVSVYLAYRWNAGGQRLFGQKEMKDTVAFWVMVISGVNLGLVAIIDKNIGMSISSNKVIFIAVGVLYLLAAYHLHKRWKSNGEKIF